MRALLVMMLLGASGVFHELSPAGVDQYLAALRAREGAFAGRLAVVARDSVGTPYAAGPLGEGPSGEYDTDPLMDLSRMDCVTFIEQSVALAASPSHAEAFALLQRIRYAGGRIDYESRNHFMITDWLANNPWCRDITDTLGAPTREVTRTISRRSFFERVNAPELGADTPDVRHTLVYIPRDGVGDALPGMPSPAMVLFVGKLDWLFILHGGLFVRDAGGEGMLYHASSQAGEVVGASLEAYLAGQERYIGMTVYALESPYWPPEAEAVPEPSH